LAEQLANIGSEVGRMIKARGDQKRFDHAAERALELFALTIDDPRHRGRLKELLRVRECLCGAILGDKSLNTSLEDLDRYFYYFAFAARKNR
jgi:hypothetical protein